MVQIEEQSDEEKLKMYLALPPEEVAKMLINCNKIISAWGPKVDLPGNGPEAPKFVICASCVGTGLNPQMSTTVYADDPDCPACAGRGWQQK